MPHILKKTIVWLGWLILGTIILAAGCVLFASRNGWEFNAVLSGSMEPVLHVGGLVVIKPADAQEIKTGEIISFKLPGVDTPVCHRVIDIREIGGKRYFQTKGDANEEPDQDLVPAASVSGKAVFRMPYVGRLIEIKSSGSTRIALLGKSLPAGTLFVLVIGLLFIGLTMKDTLDDIFHPAKRCKREMLKKRKERLLRRKKAFRIA
jgi:signal peptidase